MDKTKLIQELRSYAKHINHKYPFTWAQSAVYEYYLDEEFYEPIIPHQEYQSILVLGGHCIQDIEYLICTYPEANISVVEMNDKHVQYLYDLDLDVHHMLFSQFEPKEKYDLIYCHGVYSFIPRHEQLAIYRIAQASSSVILSDIDITQTDDILSLRDLMKGLYHKGHDLSHPEYVIRHMDYCSEELSLKEQQCIRDMKEYPTLINDWLYQPIVKGHTKDYLPKVFKHFGYSSELLVDDFWKTYLFRKQQ